LNLTIVIENNCNLDKTKRAAAEIEPEHTSKCKRRRECLLN